MEGCLLEFHRGRLDRPLEFVVVVVVEVHRRLDRIDWSNYCFVRRRSQNSFWSIVFVGVCDTVKWAGGLIMMLSGSELRGARSLIFNALLLCQRVGLTGYWIDVRSDASIVWELGRLGF